MSIILIVNHLSKKSTHYAVVCIGYGQGYDPYGYDDFSGFGGMDPYGYGDYGAAGNPPFDEIETLKDLEAFVNQSSDVDEVGGGTFGIFVIPDFNPDVNFSKLFCISNILYCEGSE